MVCGNSAGQMLIHQKIAVRISRIATSTNCDNAFTDPPRPTDRSTRKGELRRSRDQRLHQWPPYFSIFSKPSIWYLLTRLPIALLIV